MRYGGKWHRLNGGKWAVLVYSKVAGDWVQVEKNGKATNLVVNRLIKRKDGYSILEIVPERVANVIKSGKEDYYGECRIVKHGERYLAVIENGAKGGGIVSNDGKEYILLAKEGAADGFEYWSFLSDEAKEALHFGKSMI